MHMRNLVAVGLMLTTLGCAEHFYRIYEHAQVVRSQDGDYELSTGPNAVLEIYKFRGLPVPDAFSGSSLLLELNPTLLRLNEPIQVPTAGAKAYLWLFHAPIHERTEVVMGTVTPLEFGAGHLLARVDLSSSTPGWRYNGKARFLSTSVGFYKKSEPYVRQHDSRRSNNAMQLPGRPGTRLAEPRRRISSKGGEQGARPSRPAADRER